MAEIILTPIAELIIGKLGSFASDQVLLLRNLKPEILKLQDTVKAIQAVLLDAEEKQSHNHQVKLWLDRLSDVMYDAEDLLDDLSTEALLRRRSQAAARGRTGMAATCWSWVCSLLSFRPKQSMYDYKMAREIKAIREKLDVISKEKETFNLEVLPEEVALPSRESDSCPPTIVVGREDDKKNIIGLLLNSNSEANISAVSIVGMGGLGKTTLAQLIFDDHQVKDHFDIKAWVYVSQNFDVKVILGKMLRSIDRQSQAGPELNDLQALLRQKIEGKRFLIVLDDVWEESSRNWETLAKYLTVGALGSKVLVTTRSTKVANVSGEALKSITSTSIVEPYPLKGLSEEECWNLLLKKALPRQVPQDPRVEEIGKLILRKCVGVPLAVSTIAGVLVDSRDPKTEWPCFLEKGISRIMEEGEEDPTISALQLSFNHLPSHMKHCFTYCKVFPKGSRIDIKQLLRFWVAQGYIESEDKGLACFQTLWWRSFFQEVELDERGKISTCRMHDLMHDLVDIIAGEKIIRSSNSIVLKNIPSKTRHLMIDYDDSNDRREEEYGDNMGNASKVRTLICYRSLSKKEIKQVLDNFLRLRLLIIRHIDSDSGGEENLALDASTLLDSIDKLKHLRYLGLDCNEWEKLPDSVTNLINLQVLHLFNGRSLKELPRDIKKLVCLKHLKSDSHGLQQLTHMPKGIGELQFLQTLPVFVVGKRSGSNNNGAGLDELEGLNALCGELIIKGLANADSPVKGVYVLKEKAHLQSLVLNWHRNEDEDEDTDDEGIMEMLWPHPNLKKLKIYPGYQGMKIPNWLSSLTNLVEFSLEGCNRCEYLPSQMHQMSSLKKLIIEDCPMLKGIANDGDDCDSSPHNSTTKRLTTEEEDDDWPWFHCLSYLWTWNCPRLTRLPLFPTVEGQLKLDKVSLAPFGRTMKMKMRRGGEGEVGIDYSDDAYIHVASSSSSSSALVHVHPPLSKVTRLILWCIDDDLGSLSHRDPSSCLISLQTLIIWRCNRGVKLPGSLCSSIYLTEIWIKECGAVEYLPPLHELPSLNKLTIMDCPELKGCWWKKTKKKKQQQGNSNSDDDDYYNFDPNSMENDETEEEEEEEEWPHFPCLSTLEIRRCPKLTRMPLFPTVEGELNLSGTSAEAVVRTTKMKVVSLVTPPLSKLSRLNLGNIGDLKSLPEEGLSNLTSLRELSISGCRRLVSLPPAMRHLTSLQELSVRHCPILASLPPAMRHLTSLQELWIYNCPLLRERCRKEEGEDWPNISHIPRIKLDEVRIQD